MIAMRVQREPSDMGATLGALYINDRFVCWTLEDVVREPVRDGVLRNVAITAVEVAAWKIPGITAIPAGHYEVRMEWSPKFNRILPELKGVPGFTETKFHAGNRHEDTDGCIIVGHERTQNTVLHSRDALGDVLMRLDGRDRIFVDVHNPPGRHYSQPITPPGSAA